MTSILNPIKIYFSLKIKFYKAQWGQWFQLKAFPSFLYTQAFSLYIL